MTDTCPVVSNEGFVAPPLEILRVEPMILTGGKTFTTLHDWFTSIPPFSINDLPSKERVYVAMVPSDFDQPLGLSNPGIVAVSTGINSHGDLFREMHLRHLLRKKLGEVDYVGMYTKRESIYDPEISGCLRRFNERRYIEAHLWCCGYKYLRVGMNGTLGMTTVSGDRHSSIGLFSSAPRDEDGICSAVYDEYLRRLKIEWGSALSLLLTQNGMGEDNLEFYLCEISH